MRMGRLLALVGLIMVMVAGTACAQLTETGFPLRAKYPDVPIITIDELVAQFDTAIVVDVRSKLEYDVIKVNGAHRIAVTHATFLDEVEKLRAKDGKASIAFYCNGHSCAKSYDATEMAMKAGFKNVYCFDAGPFLLGKQHPDKVALLGKTPMDITKAIPDEEYKSHLVKYEVVLAEASKPGVVVIDVRDPFQREFIPNIPNLRNIPLDRIVQVLQSGDFKDQTMYVLDATAKQVAWLQYYLNEYGYTKYYFIDGGADRIPR